MALIDILELIIACVQKPTRTAKVIIGILRSISDVNIYNFDLQVEVILLSPELSRHLPRVTFILYWRGLEVTLQPTTANQLP